MLRRGPVCCTSEHGVARVGWKASAREHRLAQRSPQAGCLTYALDAGRPCFSSQPCSGWRGSGKAHRRVASPGRGCRQNSRPPTPSAMTWCKTTTSAAPPSARSVIRTIDHSGASFRNGVMITERPLQQCVLISRRLARYRPNMMINVKVRIIGPHRTPTSGGTLINRCRNRGTARMRFEMSLRSSNKPRNHPADPRSRSPNCCGTLPYPLPETPSRPNSHVRWPTSSHSTARLAGCISSIPPAYRVLRQVQCPRKQGRSALMLAVLRRNRRGWQRQLSLLGSPLPGNVFLILKDGPGTGNGTLTTSRWS